MKNHWLVVIFSLHSSIQFTTAEVLSTSYSFLLLTQQKVCRCTEVTTFLNNLSDVENLLPHSPGKREAYLFRRTLWKEKRVDPLHLPFCVTESLHPQGVSCDIKQCNKFSRFNRLFIKCLKRFCINNITLTFFSRS